VHRVLVRRPIIVSVELSVVVLSGSVVKAMDTTHGRATFFELAEVFLAVFDSVILLVSDGANKATQGLIHSSDV